MSDTSYDVTAVILKAVGEGDEELEFTWPGYFRLPVVGEWLALPGRQVQVMAVAFEMSTETEPADPPFRLTSIEPGPMSVRLTCGREQSR